MYVCLCMHIFDTLTLTYQLTDGVVMMLASVGSPWLYVLSHTLRPMLIKDKSVKFLSQM